MINYWWVTRPKRKLNSVPEVLADIAQVSLDQEWEGQRNTHISVEEALEDAGLKRRGERRDQTGGGGRTYLAWLRSLGLIFFQESTGKIKLTLAGEAIINGEPPVDILTNQVIRYQFPSSFSIGRGVQVSGRFKIHPFQFLLRLLSDPRVAYLTNEEIAKIVITEAESDSADCLEFIIKRIVDFRNYGDSVLSNDFEYRYASGKAPKSQLGMFAHLEDVANTLINWIEYTQLAIRIDKHLVILENKRDEVNDIISKQLPFIERPQDEEYFQRKYGLDTKHNKDTRNLIGTKTITPQMIADQQIVKTYLQLALEKPIARVSDDVIDYIANATGITETVVHETLCRKYPHGAIGTFMTKYYEMAFNGKDEATDFEKATVELFDAAFGYKTKHVGPIGLTPDVLLISDEEGYAGIIDNKAYSAYSINNDHHNRMVYNYIANLDHYYYGNFPLAFFTYIAGGFGNNIDSQIRSIVAETQVHGSAIDVFNVIELVKKNTQRTITHSELKNIFSVDRKILISDINTY